MERRKYYSTNRQSIEVDLAEALMQGQAPDKGLYLPRHIPILNPNELRALRGKSYPEVAELVLGKFVLDTFSAVQLQEMCRSAYNFSVPLETAGEKRFVMRLDQGPTASFKDFAGQMMGRMFGALRKDCVQPLVILTATSGDTGSAVAHAFYQIPNIQVMVLFPPAEVSERQRRQMTTLGGNITAVGVAGKFDDCQALVKQAFADPTLQKIALTSANSINIGRLLPQMVYYFYAAAQLCEEGEPVLFSIPSGNFGDMMGALLAKRMGLPIERIVVATNANDEVPRFLETGRYEKVVPSRDCLSNAMNVGHPSNLARVVELFDGEMDETGGLRKNPDMEWMRRDLWAVSISDDETRETIRRAWHERGLLLEPHGAVGWAGLERYLAQYSSKAVAVTVETAHPAKFPEEIERCLGFSPEVPPSLAGLEKRREESLDMPADFPAFHRLLWETYC
jgi:threonine synthase